MPPQTQMIGLIRFSVLTTTYLSDRFGDVDAVADHLYDDDRMAARFHLFENLCLPSLIRQSDQAFDCVILASDRMPARHRDRLSALIGDAANIHVRFAPVGRPNELVRDGYDSISVRDASHRILFRMDDDDAVDMDFVARTRQQAAALFGAVDPDTPFILSNNWGFYLKMEQDGPNRIVESRERTPLAIGLSLVAPLGYPRNPYRYNHRHLAQTYPVFSDVSVPAFIRTLHAGNWSDATLPRHENPGPRRRTLRRCRTHFGTLLKDLEAL